MLDAATYAEPDPNACMDQGDAPQSSATEPDSQHDEFVRTVFGADPSSYAASAGSSPSADDPDADGGEYEPRDDAPDAPAQNGPEANVGRGAGPANAVPYEASGSPGERVLLGMPQREQAADNMAKMSLEDHAQVQALLEVAASHSPDEVEYVAKAIAAGHSVTELKAFQQQIAGKDQAWMDQNLRLVGGSSGKGIKQQWSHSCASTEVEAMKGELDPIYAFQLRQKNPSLDQADDKDGDALNPDLANPASAAVLGIVAGGVTLVAVSLMAPPGTFAVLVQTLSGGLVLACLVSLASGKALHPR